MAKQQELVPASVWADAEEMYKAGHSTSYIAEVTGLKPIAVGQRSRKWTRQVAEFELNPSEILPPDEVAVGSLDEVIEKALRGSIVASYADLCGRHGTILFHEFSELVKQRLAFVRTLDDMRKTRAAEHQTINLTQNNVNLSENDVAAARERLLHTVLTRIAPPAVVEASS